MIFSSISHTCILHLPPSCMKIQHRQPGDRDPSSQWLSQTHREYFLRRRASLQRRGHSSSSRPTCPFLQTPARYCVLSNRRSNIEPSRTLAICMQGLPGCIKNPFAGLHSHWQLELPRGFFTKFMLSLWLLMYLPLDGKQFFPKLAFRPSPPSPHTIVSRVF